MKFINDAKLKMGVFLRERKERAEAKKALQTASHSDHGHGRFFLLTVPATATIFAAIVEVYWAILFCIEATGRLDWNFDLATAWNQPMNFVWDFAFNGNAPVLLGLLAATAPIVMISMVWLPVQFAMRGHGAWRRGSLIAAGLLCNAIVIISGTVVMNHNRQEQVRGTLAIEQQAQQNVRALEARRTQIQGRLDTLTEPSNTTLQAQAARAGAIGWDEYIATARRQAQEGTITPSRLALIERARGSAVAAETYQTQIDDLTAQIAAAPTAAEVAPTVEDTVGQGMNAFAEQVKVYRPPLIAVACTIIGILGAWWTLAMLMHMNPRDVMRSGWADEGHRIEDLRDQEPVVPKPMTPAREAVFDADSGEELIPVRATWRKKPKRKGERGQMETAADAPLTERNSSEDGGNRTATSGGSVESESLGVDAAASAEIVKDEPNSDAEAEDKAADHHGEHQEMDHQQTIPPIDFEALAAQVAEETEVQENSGETADNDHEEDASEVAESEAETVDHTEEPRQPEQREDRMLAPPSVAAE